MHTLKEIKAAYYNIIYLMNDIDNTGYFYGITTDFGKTVIIWKTSVTKPLVNLVDF